ncbi:zinc finger MYM-type 6-like [Paramuricea clavata]|uniref:Zinc finger MYM-type 6-like n=1 Tax=Paramuricea clavata TaxID=317549 RepID=A0A7D9HMH3_PARCT|nr:zinc finger MYM-type 6-like [Paramuricea clavata]
MSLSKPSATASTNRGNRWKSHYDSSRKFKSDWTRKYPWIKKAMDGSDDAHCSLCRTNITPRLSNISKHEESAKHKRQANLVSHNSKISLAPRNVNDHIKEMELQLALAITCHTSIMAIDHLGEIMVNHGKGSSLEHLKLHRTKCSLLIKEVIAPALYRDLCEDMAGQKYCVILDESTDVSCNKLLCVIIRFYSKSEKKIVTALLSLIPVIKATGENLFQALKGSLENAGLSLANCVGYASDGASVMVGEHNSVWSRIKEESPNCILIKCVCHSLALCIKHAFEKMPANIGFMLSEIPKWFSKSSVRRDSYKQLFTAFEGCPAEESTLPLPFQKCNQTRWLVRGKVIYNILTNWEILQTYFSLAESEVDVNVRFKARMIKEMLNDPINHLYFHFLSPMVSEVERVNAFFQATDLEAHAMMKELSVYYDSLKGRVYSSSGVPLPTDKVDYGAKFVFEADALIPHQNNDEHTVRKVREVYGRCHTMLLEAAAQVQKRLPSSKDIFQGLSHLHPSKILNQVGRIALAKLPMQHLIHEKIDEIDNQYRSILYVNWQESGTFEDGIPNDTISFLSGVLEYQDGQFEDLATFALACLTTPTSNAVVERMFSYVTRIKTKSRNKMSSSMLEAIVRIRTHLYFREMCCKDLKPSKRMLELFTKDIYKKATDSLNDEDEVELHE